MRTTVPVINGVSKLIADVLVQPILIQLMEWTVGMGCVTNLLVHAPVARLGKNLSFNFSCVRKVVSTRKMEKRANEKKVERWLSVFVFMVAANSTTFFHTRSNKGSIMELLV
jgi:hypothetical protein